MCVEQQKAVNECARVTKPGGYVGLNESTWIKEPPPELPEQVTRSLGGNLDIQTPEEWRALLESSGLKDVIAKASAITAGSEISNRLRRLGGVKGVARIMARMPSVLIKRSVYTSFVKDAFSTPRELFSYWGYGVYVGRK